MKIALIAHDKKKDEIIELAKKYQDVLAKYELYATGTTGTLIMGETGLKITRMKSGPKGGDQQIAARLQYNEIDMLLFFRDPITAKANEPSAANLLRLCDENNIPVATNIATAEVLVHGLERGDLDWRNIINPKNMR